MGVRAGHRQTAVGQGDLVVGPVAVGQVHHTVGGGGVDVDRGQPPGVRRGVRPQTQRRRGGGRVEGLFAVGRGQGPQGVPRRVVLGRGHVPARGVGAGPVGAGVVGGVDRSAVDVQIGDAAVAQVTRPVAGDTGARREDHRPGGGKVALPPGRGDAHVGPVVQVGAVRRHRNRVPHRRGQRAAAVSRVMRAIGGREPVRGVIGQVPGGLPRRGDHVDPTGGVVAVGRGQHRGPAHHRMGKAAGGGVAGVPGAGQLPAGVGEAGHVDQQHRAPGVGHQGDRGQVRRRVIRHLQAPAPGWPLRCGRRGPGPDAARRGRGRDRRGRVLLIDLPIRQIGVGRGPHRAGAGHRGHLVGVRRPRGRAGGEAGRDRRERGRVPVQVSEGEPGRPVGPRGRGQGVAGPGVDTGRDVPAAAGLAEQHLRAVVDGQDHRAAVVGQPGEVAAGRPHRQVRDPARPEHALLDQGRGVVEHRLRGVGGDVGVAVVEPHESLRGCGRDGERQRQRHPRVGHRRGVRHHRGVVHSDLPGDGHLLVAAVGIGRQDPRGGRHEHVRGQRVGPPRNHAQPHRAGVPTDRRIGVVGAGGGVRGDAQTLRAAERPCGAAHRGDTDRAEVGQRALDVLLERVEQLHRIRGDGVGVAGVERPRQRQVTALHPRRRDIPSGDREVAGGQRHRARPDRGGGERLPERLLVQHHLQRAGRAGARLRPSRGHREAHLQLQRAVDPTQGRGGVPVQSLRGRGAARPVGVGVGERLRHRRATGVDGQVRVGDLRESVRIRAPPLVRDVGVALHRVGLRG